jgi:hypothetical protein
VDTFDSASGHWQTTDHVAVAHDAERIDICPEKEAVARRAFKLSDPLHGFPDCLKAPNKAPFSLAGLAALAPTGEGE